MEIERFLQDLTTKIIESAGTAKYDLVSARRLAEEVLRRLRVIGVDAYPSLLDTEELRFIYQWDEEPPVLTIMLWDDVMWRDMARLVVPRELIA